jgi:hypothetical protein
MPLITTQPWEVRQLRFLLVDPRSVMSYFTLVILSASTNIAHSWADRRNRFKVLYLQFRVFQTSRSPYG